MCRFQLNCQALNICSFQWGREMKNYHETLLQAACPALVCKCHLCTGVLQENGRHQLLEKCVSGFIGRGAAWGERGEQGGECGWRAQLAVGGPAAEKVAQGLLALRQWGGEVSAGLALAWRASFPELLHACTEPKGSAHEQKPACPWLIAQQQSYKFWDTQGTSCSFSL